MIIRLLALSCAMFLFIAAPAARAAQAAEQGFDIPPWFAETFLDFRDDLRDAAKAGKRLMLYFGQDGCPYCKELIQTNFSQKPIVGKTQKHFTALALNIWGDREVTWIDGRSMSEKEFAKMLKVQFTPTVLFLDEKGGIAARLNGYYPPQRFEAVLDYVAGRMEGKQPLADYLKSAVKESANPTLHEQPFFMKAPFDLRRKEGGKPLAVVFETRHCAPCDEMHREGFERREVKALLAQFDVARFALSDRSDITTPGGKKMSAEAWARQLKVAYTPSIVFFDAHGKEAFRIEAYLRPFHLSSSFEYVASGAWRSEPEFQRFLQAKAEKMRARGEKVELWQ